MSRCGDEHLGIDTVRMILVHEVGKDVMQWLRLTDSWVNDPDSPPMTLFKYIEEGLNHLLNASRSMSG
jgi:hypothetical protein